MLVATGQRETTRRLWVHGPVADIALGWCWLPIALIVHAAEPHLTAVQSIMGVSLSAVALMAGLWNAEHTLMQRYGVMRIYGRKAGDDHGRLEKPMLIVWLVAAISYMGGYVDLQRLVRKLG